jgi:four helix bundle protein
VKIERFFDFSISRFLQALSASSMAEADTGRHFGEDLMLEAAQALERRTKAFAVAVLRFLSRLPSAPEILVVRRQLGKASTSVAANYRATCRSRSRLEFVARLGVVVEEADESVLWLEILLESDLLSKDARPGAQTLLRESRELRAIFSSSVVTARGRD